MTVKHHDAREDLIWSMTDCLTDARIAAQCNHGWESNPYQEFSPLWAAWAREYKRELERVVQREEVRREFRSKESARHVAALQHQLDKPEPWSLRKWIASFFEGRQS